MKVCMIGLGKLGAPVAEQMARHHDVTGYDVRDDVQCEGVDIRSSVAEAVQDRDMVFVAVPTPHHPRYGGDQPTSDLPACDFDYTALTEALVQVTDHTQPHTVIVNISTVLPGTLRPIIHRLGCQDRFCYNPYLIAMGTVADDFCAPDIMIMGFDQWPHAEHQRQADVITEFYRTMHRTQPHITCGTWEEAECIKIFHNTYISAKVTIANMIQDVTHRIGHADPSRVAESLRHARRITSGSYMEPGMGDGGPCHPRDNIALSWLADRLNLGYDLFRDIMRTRERQCELIAEELMRHHLPITIVGTAFKPGTDLRDGSAGLLVAHYCREQGGDVHLDHSDHSGAQVYLLCHDRDHSDVVITEGSVVVDMYRRMRPRSGITVIHWGRGPATPNDMV